jgi:acyl carrier protein
MGDTEMNQQEALSWIADVFEESAENIRPGTRKDEVPGWDSLGILALIAALDKDFDIVLEPEAIQAMSSVEDILEVLRHQGRLEGESSREHAG